MFAVISNQFLPFIRKVANFNLVKSCGFQAQKRNCFHLILRKYFVIQNIFYQTKNMEIHLRYQKEAHRISYWFVWNVF